ncbi:MAG: hypothetical protein QM733_17230 [Ilumatobacteraceae bacterium]
MRQHQTDVNALRQSVIDYGAEVLGLPAQQVTDIVMNVNDKQPLRTEARRAAHRRAPRRPRPAVIGRRRRVLTAAAHWAVLRPPVEALVTGVVVVRPVVVVDDGLVLAIPAHLARHPASVQRRAHRT